MNNNKKIVIAGRVSTYTPGIISTIVSKLEGMPVGNITLHDIDEKNLNSMGKYVQIFFKANKINIVVEWATNLVLSCQGADFVFA